MNRTTKAQRSLFLLKLGPIVALLIILTQGGCGLEKPYPAIVTYSLEMTRPHMTLSAKNNKKKLLLIGQAQAAAGYEGRKLTYKTGPQTYVTDFYHELTAPPIRLIADLCAREIDLQNSYFEVQRNQGLALADFSLEIYLEEIYGDFTQNPPEAVLSLKFILSDLKGQKGTVVFSKNYFQNIPLLNDAPKDPEPLVASLSLALQNILEALNMDLEQVHAH